MFVPPVGTGVEKFEGNSEVNIVAFDGDKVYRAVRTSTSALVKPLTLLPFPTTIRLSHNDDRDGTSGTAMIVLCTAPAILSSTLSLASDAGVAAKNLSGPISISRFRFRVLPSTSILVLSEGG